MTNQNFVITQVEKNELISLSEWVIKEGWNPGIHDATTFYKADSTAFFVGKLKNEPVAMVSAKIYDDTFAFFGFLIVKPEHRDKGYGLALTQARLNYVGNRTVGLDGVVNMQTIYEKNQFKLIHRNLRYQLSSQNRNSSFPFITPLSQIPLNSLIKYDTKHFFTAREQFLNVWISQPESFSYAFYKENQIKGYGLMRPCQIGYKIGPLFADDMEIAEQLLLTFMNDARGKEIFIDTPDLNKEGLALFEKYHARVVFETGRMYKNKAPQLPLKNIYGLTSLEFG